VGVEWAEWSEPAEARPGRWPVQWIQDVAERLSPDPAGPPADPETPRPVGLVPGLNLDLDPGATDDAEGRPDDTGKSS
jgi:hypothetical protein